jgi:hypothetical protein
MGERAMNNIAPKIDLSNQAVHLGTLGEGRILAFTTESPYLCFEAESHEALLVIVREAFEFCAWANAEIDKRIARERENTKSIKIEKTVRIKDLVFA